MTIQVPNATQDAEAWLHESFGDFIYVPLAWRTGQSRIGVGAGAGAEIEEALRDLHAAFTDLPVPDRLLDLVRRA